MSSFSNILTLQSTVTYFGIGILGLLSPFHSYAFLSKFSNLLVCHFCSLQRLQSSLLPFCYSFFLFIQLCSFLFQFPLALPSMNKSIQICSFSLKTDIFECFLALERRKKASQTRTKINFLPLPFCVQNSYPFTQFRLLWAHFEIRILWPNSHVKDLRKFSAAFEGN